MDKPVFAPGTPAEWVGVVVEGNQIMAVMGPDLVKGFSGFGDTIPQALRDLATHIEREGWRSPTVDLRADPPRKPLGVIQGKKPSGVEPQ
jgi:hypothetical protein